MFTTDWFTMHAGVWERYVLPAEPQNVLEIGCYEGRATKWILERTGARVTVVDTFQGSPEHDVSGLRERFETNISDYQDRVTICEGASRDVLPELKGSFDLVYIDGSHKAEDVLFDFTYSHRLATGLIVFDDYEWTYDLPERDKPGIAIDAILSICDLDVIYKGYQVIVSTSTRSA